MEKSPCQSDLGADFEWLVDMIFTSTIVLIVWVILCFCATGVPVSCGVQNSAGPKHCASSSQGVVTGTFNLQLQHFPSFLDAFCINFQGVFDRWFILCGVAVLR